MKFDGSMKEVFDFIEGTGQMPELKMKIAGALLALVDTDEMKATIKIMANDMVHVAVKNAVSEALFTRKVGGGNNREVLGWASEDVKQAIREVLQPDGLKSIIHDAVYEEAKKVEKRHVELREGILPFVEKQVCRLIPEHVTEAYRNQVAEHFNNNRLEEYVTSITQKVFGKMLMAGTVQLNIKAD